MNTNSAKLFCCLVLASGLSTQPVRASGFDTSRFGSEHGHAAGATPFALYYNPAALATTRKLHVAADMQLLIHRAAYDRTHSSVPEPADATGANTGEAKVSDVAVSPSAAAAYHLGDAVVALGVFAPLAGIQSWQGGGASYPQYPGTSDGSARWHLVEGGMTVSYASAGAAYTFTPIRLSVGAAANLTYTRLNFTRAQTAAANDDIATEGRTNVDLSQLGGTFGLGLHWEAIADQLYLGLSYQAPPGMYKDQTLSGDLNNLLSGTMPTHATADVKQALPDILRWAVRVRPRPTYELRLFGDFARWSTFKRQCLVQHGASCELDAAPADSKIILNQRRDWKNTFAIRGGGSYYFSERWEGFLGMGYDGNPIPLGTLDASVIEGHNLSWTLGGRARFADHYAALVSCSYDYWLERDSTGKSVLDRTPFPTKAPDSSGVYNQYAVTISTMLELYFD